VELARGKPDGATESRSFLKVNEVKNLLGVEMLLTELDCEETETIVLAREINADLVSKLNLNAQTTIPKHLASPSMPLRYRLHR